MINKKNTKVKYKQTASSIVMYSIAAIILLIAAAFLFNNVKMFKATIDQYVASGYDAKGVSSVLFAQQLLPGIFQAVALYGGIAAILIFGGIINNKISICLEALNKEEPALQCELCENANDVENKSIEPQED